MIVAIHQPEYFPCLALLAKLRAADTVVLLDDVQFKRDSLQQRCKVAGPRGVQWLTIPFVHAHPQLIRDVRVADPTWPARHLGMIRALYGEAPGFAVAWPHVEALLSAPCESVAEIATASMHLLLEAFGGAVQTLHSSKLGAEGQKGDRVLDICRRLGATHYMSGRGGAEYLDRAAFAAAGVEIVLSTYQAPRYREGLPSDPGLSALDAWMWLGDKAKGVLS